MAKFDVYDLTAKKVSTVTLPDEVYSAKVNTQAIFDAVLRQQSSMMQGTHDTKTKGEVSGGGKKPFRQKGTGRARQGSSRAVQYRHGGIAFGPTPRSHTFKLNRKTRRLALKSGLTLKAQEEKLFILDSIEMKEIKTKEFVKVLDAFKLDRKVLVVVNPEDAFENALYSMSNLQNCKMVTVDCGSWFLDGLNIYDLQNADAVVMTKAAAEYAGEVLKDE